MRHNRFRNPMLDPPSEPLPKPQRPPTNLLSLHDQELLARRAMQKKQDDTVIFDQLFSSDTATGAVKRVRHAQFVRLDKKKEDEARCAHQQRQQAQVRARIDASLSFANSFPAPSSSNSRTSQLANSFYFSSNLPSDRSSIGVSAQALSSHAASPYSAQQTPHAPELSEDQHLVIDIDDDESPEGCSLTSPAHNQILRELGDVEATCQSHVQDAQQEQEQEEEEEEEEAEEEEEEEEEASAAALKVRKLVPRALMCA